MRRRFLLVPALTLSAWAQQTPPSASEAEAALRARVEQFYQLEVDKKFRQAEALLAEDSRDIFYNANKPVIQGFTIDRIELTENNTRADVYVKTKLTYVIPGFPPMIGETQVTSTWRVENGAWVQFIDPDAPIQTPFGKVKPAKPGEKPDAIPRQFKVPDLATLSQMVKIDRNSIVLTRAEPVQTATISNGLAGGVDLKIASNGLGGVDAELDKTHLESGEKAVIRFRAKDDNHASGVVQVRVAPLGQTLAIQVTAN